jgi:hypothetical protein
MFGSLSSEFDKQIQLIEECFSLWQRSKSSQLTTTIKTTLSNVCFRDFILILNHLFLFLVSF